MDHIVEYRLFARVFGKIFTKYISEIYKQSLIVVILTVQNLSADILPDGHLSFYYTYLI